MNNRRTAKAGCLYLLVLSVVLVTACPKPVNSPQQPDKTLLLEKIAEAQALAGILAESADGTDVPEDVYWVFPYIKEALTDAISAAQAVADNPNATVSQIEGVLHTLTVVYDAANEAKALGTKSPLADKLALAAKIAEAEALAALLEVSADGTDVPEEAFWVIPSIKEALNDAISAAQAVIDDPYATAREADAAMEALVDAYNAADEAKAPGTKPPLADKLPLIAKIAEAEALAALLEVSADGTDVYKDDYWVVPSIKEALTDAISAAQAVVDDPYATAPQADAAMRALVAAYDTADEAKAFGTYMVNKSALREKINAANEKMEGVRQSPDGLDVLNTQKWATEAMFTVLQDALADAAEVNRNEDVTQEDVDAALLILDAAIVNFVPQNGLLVQSVITYKFTGPADEAVTLTGAQVLSWTDNTELVVTVTETFNSYQWYVDGIIKAGESGNQITLNARDFSPGTHTVTIKVVKNGVPFTKTLAFTVN